MTEHETGTLTKAEIFVNEIVFYSKEEISLLGFIQQGSEYIETEFVITRRQLQILLSGNKKHGIEILWRIEQLFVYPHQSPAAINLVELFGTTQVLEARRIVMARAETSNRVFVNSLLPLTAVGRKFF